MEPMASVEKNELSEITLDRLRRHFREKYLLKEPQVELMLQSSAQSLRHGLGQLIAVLNGGEERRALVGIYHGFKGLFLNMGEGDWADYTRIIEGKLKNGEELDHQAIVTTLRRGFAEVLSLEEVKQP